VIDLEKFIYSVVENMKSIHLFNEYNEFDFIHDRAENKSYTIIGYVLGHRQQSA
jgi:hypothetical protein